MPPLAETPTPPAPPARPDIWLAPPSPPIIIALLVRVVMLPPLKMAVPASAACCTHGVGDASRSTGNHSSVGQRHDRLTAKHAPAARRARAAGGAADRSIVHQRRDRASGSVNAIRAAVYDAGACDGYSPAIAEDRARRRHRDGLERRNASSRNVGRAERRKRYKRSPGEQRGSEKALIPCTCQSRRICKAHARVTRSFAGFDWAHEKAPLKNEFRYLLQKQRTNPSGSK